MADAVVADTVAGAVSDTPASDAADAAGKAVPAGVAGHEPYVPGSGARVPAELRLVLAGYVGVACGLFVVGALACAAVGVFIFVDDPMIFFLGVLAFLALFLGFAQGVFEALEPRIRFPGCSGGAVIHAWPR